MVWEQLSSRFYDILGTRLDPYQHGGDCVVNLRVGDVVLYPLENADSFVVISDPFVTISGYECVRVMYLDDGVLSAELFTGMLYEDAVYIPVSS